MKCEKLSPSFKDYIWGGEKLKEKYGKTGAPSPCAESWELSFHPDGPARLSDGRLLSSAAKKRDLGKNVSDFPDFPVLVKLIDAKRDLSVQVHPTDDYAKERENASGKTEMWYVAEAEKGACLYVGFNRDVSRAEVEKAAKDGTVMSLLGRYEVKPGDVFFIHAGTVHAIGAGCLICEIQQNSNITYRVYDYKRKDKNGNERPLHLKQALEVMDLKKYEPFAFESESGGGIIGACRYFTASRLDVDGECVIKADPASFRCAVCVGGEGTVGKERMSRGDSFFIPASREAAVRGKAELIVVSVRKYGIGIDLGGTFIKGGVVDDLGNVIASGKIPTESALGADRVAERIAELCKTLAADSGMTLSDMRGVGIGSPGMIDSEKGEVVYANNLGWEHFNISRKVGEMTGLRVSVVNDANAAAYGEARFGAGRGCRNMILLTLGTGVGGGIVIDGKLYGGNRSAGAELGHTVIVSGGERCSCGRRGCLEAYASATALIRETKKAMAAHPESALCSAKTVDGKTAFALRESDECAKRITDEYLDKLACGITNFANVFRPEAVLIGGGISAEGAKMTDILQEKVDGEIYGAEKGPRVRIAPASLKNGAGILGAAALVL